MESMTLTLNEVKENLTKVDFSKLPKPKKTNKGKRGQLLELALGIANTSKLTDCVDGELKSFTQGESIAVTQLKHILPQIFANIPIYRTKLGIKTQQTLFVGFDRDNNFIGSTTLTPESDPKHFEQLEQDFHDICDAILDAYYDKKELHTVTGRNGLLQIRTKDSKYKGKYHPIIWKGQQLSDKGFAFYLTGKFGRELL
jgi:DNA mismatch repair protein MutH